MDLKKQGLLTIIGQLLLNLIVTAIATVLLTPYVFKDNPWGFVVIGMIVFVLLTVLIAGTQWRFLKLLVSGWCPGCYYSFPVTENQKIWNQATRSLKYLGISTGTFLDEFSKWAVTKADKIDPLEFKFLIMDPDARALRKQVAFKKNMDVNHPDVVSEVNRQKDRIRTYLQDLEGMELYKRGKLTIRKHDEFIPWWIYIVDDNKAFVGILERGKDGRDSPLMTFKKHEKYGSPFDAFQNTWERMWEGGKDT